MRRRLTLGGLAAAAIVAMIACQDATSPRRMAGTRPAGAVDSLSLVFAEDARPLQAAVVAPDSAGARVRLGHAEIDARAGDSLALHVRTDSSVLRAAGQITIQLVVDGQEVGRASLQQLAGPGLVYSLVSAGEQTVDVFLERGLPASARAQVANAAFLVQGMTSATVRVAGSPWVHARRGLHFNTAIGDGCILDDPQPDGTCGAVQYHLDPFVYGGGSFQSAPGYGPSSPITVTFASPVQTVGITIGDPTYDGNTAVAYDSTGNVVASTGFSFSGTPGQDEPDTKFLSAPAISRVVLTPAADDYVNYTMSVNVPDATSAASLTCTEGPVLRGAPVTCTAAGFDVITGWIFKSDDGEQTVWRDADITSKVWSGPLVLSGTVTVTGTAAGIRKREERARVAVRARDWSGKSQPDDIQEVPRSDPGWSKSQIEDRPWRFEAQLGVTRSGSEGRKDIGSVIGNVSGGPNEGLHYFTDVPVHVSSLVYINRVALDPSSEFAQLQPPHDTVVDGHSVCGRDRFPGLLTAVEVHEGLHGEPFSHTRLFHDAAFGRAAALFESAVGTVSDDFFGPANEFVIRAGNEASRQRDGALNNLTTAVTPYSSYVFRCDFNYFPKPNR